MIVNQKPLIIKNLIGFKKNKNRKAERSQIEQTRHDSHGFILFFTQDKRQQKSDER